MSGRRGVCAAPVDALPREKHGKSGLSGPENKRVFRSGKSLILGSCCPYKTSFSGSDLRDRRSMRRSCTTSPAQQAVGSFVPQFAPNPQNKSRALLPLYSGRKTKQKQRPDLPPLNGTTSRAIIWWCHNQRRAFHATRYCLIQPRVKSLCLKHNLPYRQESVFRRFGRMLDVCVGKTSMRQLEVFPVACTNISGN